MDFEKNLREMEERFGFSRGGDDEEESRGRHGRSRNGVPRGPSDQDLFDSVDAVIEDLERERDSAPWITTFGDLMSLLLVFFVMLYAMSEIKVQKFVEVAESLKKGFGVSMMESVSGVTEEIEDEPVDDGAVENQVDDYLRYIKHRMQAFVAEHELANTLDVTMDETGVTLRIQDMVLFDEASAAIRPESRWIAVRLSQIVKEIAVPAIVAGHTDAKPISTEKFPSNWELSGARAATLARIFIDQGFDPHGIHIEGFGPYRPVAANDTPEGRAENRRVELLYTRQNVFAKLVHDENRRLTPGGWAPRAR